MDYFVSALREHQELAIFLSLACWARARERAR